MSQEITSLEELFGEAMTTLRAERAVKAKTPKKQRPPDLPVEPERLYTNPENWTRKRGLALIHEETQTLLGNFSEYVHKDGTSRKLLREDGVLVVEATETVSGDWWIGQGREEIAAPEHWHTQRQVVCSIELPELGVHSPACPLIVWLSYGHMARITLEFETMLAQRESQRDQLLFLPAGVNILSLMSHDCKVAVRIELEKESQA